MMKRRRESDAQISVLLEQLHTVIEKLDEQKAAVKDINNRLDVLETDYTKYKSFFGGIMFVLTAVWAFLGFAWDNLREALARLFGVHQ